jgi:hypothetical protein
VSASSAPYDISSELADQGGRSVRRLVNRSIYDRAVQLGVAGDVLMEFLCECGHLECGDLVRLRLTEFDTSSLPGSVTAHGEPLPEHAEQQTALRGS